jgi:hypothetical protein
MLSETGCLGTSVSDETCSSIEHLWKSNWLGNVEVLGEKLTLCHFGHGKVYLHCSGREDVPVLQEPGDGELCQNLVRLLHL